MSVFRGLITLLRGDPQADRVVPPTGFTVRLTVFTSAAMAFLAVFALALSISAGRLADRWSGALARTATVRISAPEGQMATQAAAVLEALRTTPGVAEARLLTPDDQKTLLAPWFGPDLPVEDLPLPALVELRETAEGFDAAALRLRLSAEAPGAVLDDHTRWRQPLVTAADRLRLLAVLSLALITAASGAMIVLSANAALAANEKVIATLRLVGARDVYIARAFVRRFTGRALQGAAVGAALATGGVALLPGADSAGGFLTGLGFAGAGWALPVIIPVAAAVVAFWSTRLAAFRVLRGIS
ncbi:cell division protein FtsX [Actibacterium mucosum KCTC 23349]|uniref:Cell division protein FtsX n=1 Tax=Actibacterium mucosum KCTC 23349 TaxID=1454373 RepID=A0A037ZJ03_9RHOB|nr:cell division protein FtsX [Actibacterium mucosum]KAJ56093.1 cell division protein FtsX [Actibacterium mucosum KCTC 23349]